jgi:urate oxidase
MNDKYSNLSYSINKSSIIKCLELENNIIYNKYSKIINKKYSKEQLKSISVIQELDLANNIIQTLIYLEGVKTLIVKFPRVTKVLKDYKNKHSLDN